MDLVSVVIPVYNTGELFRPCIESVLNQTYSNIEVVVVDDHSTDPQTLELLQEYAGKDSRIKLILGSENHGPSYCRNRGVDAATGKFFTFIDSDDVFVPDFIERAHQSIVENHTDFVVCNIKNVVNDSSVKLDPDFVFNMPETGIVRTVDYIKAGKLLNAPVTACGKLINVQKYRSAKLDFVEEMRYAEDQDWTYRLFCSMGSFTVLDFFCINRILHRHSIMHTVKYQDLVQCIHSVYLRAEVLKQYGCFEQYRSELFDLGCLYLEDSLQGLDDFAEWLKLFQFAVQEFNRIGYSMKSHPTKFDLIICWFKYKLGKTLGLKDVRVINKALYKAYSLMLKD